MKEQIIKTSEIKKYEKEITKGRTTCCKYE